MAAAAEADTYRLLSTYKQLESFYGKVDAELLAHILARPTRNAFTKTMGPAAVGGRLTGGKRAQEVATGLLQAAKQHPQMSFDTFVEYVKPLPLLESTYSNLATYEFKKQGACDAWLAHLETAEGFKVNAEAAGCNYVKVLHSTMELSKVTVYSEWDRSESFVQHCERLASSGYAAKWLDAELVGGAPTTEGFTPLAQRISEIGKIGEYVCTTSYDFKEPADCDAWLAHFLAADDGLKFMAEFAGCNLVRIHRSLDAPAKVVFYEEWNDHYSVQRHSAARAEMGDLARWFGADGVVGEWSKLSGEAAAVHEYKVRTAYATDMLAFNEPLRHEPHFDPTAYTVFSDRG